MGFWGRNVPGKGKGKSFGEAKALLKESGNEGKGVSNQVMWGIIVKNENTHFFLREVIGSFYFSKRKPQSAMYYL